MIPMTTQELGQAPGRARLGASGHSSARRSHGICTARSRCWHRATLVSMVNLAATMPYSGTATKGFGSNKRPTRHLGTRST